MIALLSALTSIQGCMEDNTQMILDTIQNIIQLKLVPSENAACEILPSAVQIQLRFANNVLDQQVVVTDYNYEETLLVIFKVADITKYLGIDSAIMTIRSYSEVYYRNVLEIVIQRSETSLVVTEIQSSKYDGNIVTIVVELNKLITQPLQQAVLTICTVSCQTFNQKTITNAANIWTIVIEAPNQKEKISQFGIKQIEFTLFYGNKVLQSVNFPDIPMELAYQQAIGTLTDVFLYQSEIYIFIESSAEFYTYARNGFDSIELIFDFGVCKMVTKGSLDDFLYHEFNIQLQIAKSQFENPDQFEKCTQNALFYNQKLRLIVDVKGKSYNASYLLTSDITQSWFVDSSLVLSNANIAILSYVIPSVKLEFNKYKYQLQTFNSLEDQLLQNGIIIFESAVNLTSGQNFSITIQKTPSLTKAITDTFSTYLLIVNEKGVGIMDGKLQVYNTATTQFIIFNVIISAGLIFFSVCVGAIVIFWKPKPKRNKKVKEIQIDDIK